MNRLQNLDFQLSYAGHHQSAILLICESGIKPLYSKVFTMEEIVEAHTLLEKGGAGGKIILTIA